MALFIILAALWYVIGVTGFVFWWTADSDFTVAELLIAILLGFAGPFAWFIGYTIHGARRPAFIIKRKRYLEVK